MYSPFLYFSWYLRKSILLLICFVSYARTIKLCKYFVRVNICARVKVCMPTLYTSNFLSNFIMEKMMQYVCDVCVGYQFSKQNIIFMLHDVVSSQYQYRYRKIYRKSMFGFWYLTKTLLNHAHEFKSFTLCYNPTLSEHGLNFGNRKSLRVVHFRKILHWYKLNFILSI